MDNVENSENVNNFNNVNNSENINDTGNGEDGYVFHNFLPDNDEVIVVLLCNIVKQNI